MQCSRAIGETKEEQLAFISFALGKADKELQPLPPPYRQADVAVLDQHIVLDGKPHLLGTELARDLRASMVNMPSSAGQSLPSQPPHMEAFGSRLLYLLWRSHGATQHALGG